MEKIILRNSQEFNIPPLGIIGNDLTKRRKITFVSDMDYNDVLALLSNKDNTDQIEYALENGAVITTYTDCVALKSLSVDLDAGTYTAEFSTDATEFLVKELQARVEQMQQTINELTAIKEQPEPETVPDEDPAEENEPTQDEDPADPEEEEPVEETDSDEDVPDDEPSNPEP